MSRFDELNEIALEAAVRENFKKRQGYDWDSIKRGTLRDIYLEAAADTINAYHKHDPVWSDPAIAALKVQIRKLTRERDKAVAVIASLKKILFKEG